jgi:glutaredoxin
VNVQKDPDGLKAMLKASKGDRTVPIIVENGKVSIGYGGG